MTPAPETPAPETGLVRALVECPSRRVRMVFPVVAGTPREAVAAEIPARLAGSAYADVPAQADYALTYPDGPFVGLPQAPPIGGVTSPPPPSRPAEQQGPAAPPPRETGFPRHPAVPTGDRAVMLDLDDLLGTWRGRHVLTSAEYYAYLSQALARHGAQMLAHERQLAAARHPDPRTPRA